MRQCLRPSPCTFSMTGCYLLFSAVARMPGWGVWELYCMSQLLVFGLFLLFLLFLDCFEAHRPRVPTPNNETDLKIMTLPRDRCLPSEAPSTTMKEEHQRTPLGWDTALIPIPAAPSRPGHGNCTGQSIFSKEMGSGGCVKAQQSAGTVGWSCLARRSLRWGHLLGCPTNEALSAGPSCWTVPARDGRHWGFRNGKAKFIGEHKSEMWTRNMSWIWKHVFSPQHQCLSPSKSRLSGNKKILKPIAKVFPTVIIVCVDEPLNVHLHYPKIDYNKRSWLPQPSCFFTPVGASRVTHLPPWQPPWQGWGQLHFSTRQDRHAQTRWHKAVIHCRGQLLQWTQ